MTVSDYIKGKFQSFGISISEADLFDMSLNAGLEPTDELTSENKRGVEVSICRFIPSLLLRPQSVSEGQVSFSYNAQAVKDYYSILCNQYGIENLLKPTVKFL